MSTWTRIRALPIGLALETGTSLIFLVTGVLPAAIFTFTPLTLPNWLDFLGGIAIVSLGLLWLLLLCHAGVDGWRLLRQRTLHKSYVNTIQVFFRVVETIGAIAPILLYVLFEARARATDPPVPPGAAVMLIFYVAVPVLIGGLTVLFHAMWRVRITEPPTVDSTAHKR